MEVEEGLLDASGEGDNLRVRELITAGADLNTQDKDGWTALFFAAGRGYTEVVATLISEGAELNRKNNDGYN